MSEIFFQIEVYLILINATIMFIFAGSFWYITFKKTETASQKWFSFGVGLFLMGFGFTRIFFLLYDLIDLGYWTGFGLAPDLWWKFATISGLGSLLFVLIILEKYMVNTKFILSIIVSIGLVAAIILPVEEGLALDAKLATYIAIPFAVFGILGIYLYLTIKLTGKVRKKSALSFIGIFLAALGHTLATVLGIELIGVDLSILSPILMMIGIIIYSISNF
ncbi:MAG: hypothetical protein GF329_20080 [Candidatus Lokiarchaeota archaeon]|nr:hypothetical protein [Candidatus Lokiarchaeota archaeon]